ncbi:MULTISPECIES: hypothetical protein [Sutcliffiella]|uniref:Uncharacterized protein n=1 Tax=Sutcliffiella cohnii TaxID=33932 RepID=A0A223KU96_9BACI|nr:MULTISPECIES: hypothetical protein [Sutcliffiella]AST92924.1 hypothetical protein BC6307_17345 [Sutcliffiella cohnii]MED4016115.1 hypothetical protein [Sutcliffiella cohnii]WBL14185.1 hypothetical protein O1A01_20085 [Sutcliffiella sp. NC1]
MSKEGFVPEDGGWTQSKGDKVLLLSVPTLQKYIEVSVKKFSYKWLYNRELTSYILDLTFNDEHNIPLIFPQTHAGQLLLDADAYEEFSIAIIASPLEKMEDDTAYLYFPKINLKRSIHAKW